MLLKIDQEFKNLIPPLTHEDRTGLENNIKANGCETPITIWDGTIVDGHNRYEICINNGIPFEIKEIHFADRDDAKIWMIKHELEWKGRRINEYIRTSLALKSKAIIAEKAKKRMVEASHPKHNDAVGVENSTQQQYEEKLEVVNLPPPIIIKNEAKTRDEIAKLADVSSNTVSRVEKIEAKATEEQKKALVNGKKSINKIFNEIKEKEEAEKPAPIIPEPLLTQQQIQEDYEHEDSNIPESKDVTVDCSDNKTILNNQEKENSGILFELHYDPIGSCTIFQPTNADILLCPCGCGWGYCDQNETFYSKEYIINIKEK